MRVAAIFAVLAICLQLIAVGCFIAGGFQRAGNEALANIIGLTSIGLGLALAIGLSTLVWRKL